MYSLWCVLAAVVMILVSKMPLAIYMAKQSGGYNNRNPRGQMAQLDDYGQRAHAAHMNTIESFPIFAAGMIIANIADLEQKLIFSIGLVFLISRLFYIWAYVKNKATVRSLIWSVGFFASLSLYILALV